ncbi:MAG TPA: hypothetical protein VMW42_07685 [Desulfatiglandales bacterium]|jgi:hypothetical protein|nr:hypothetical protein [Desulfatiglandales bacterium]
MDKRTRRDLQSVGIECFIRDFHLFRDETLTNKDVAIILEEKYGYTYKACSSRTTKARRIIRSREDLTSALSYIVYDAVKVTEQIKEDARTLLES